LIFFDLYRATPNVWTEVGYAAALRHKPYLVVLVPTRQRDQFLRNVYLRQAQVVEYQPRKRGDLREKLVEFLKVGLKLGKEA
ncbi:MAG: hypothetical protein H5T86_16885, partial [Armatimonadetes bacterium]|nr:hypothetical protein [Armatimonadota bacterium]